MTGQVVVVTGAAGGVGECVVRRFLGRGARVVGIDRRPSSAAIAGGYDGHPPWIQRDLGTWQAATAAAREVGALVERVDLLVNAAGTFAADRESEDPGTLLPRLLADNLHSAVFLSLALHSLLRRADKPQVVNVASTDGVVASGGQDCEIGVGHDLLYASSKGALVTFTRALAMKWASDGIRVNAVCPSVIRSPMTAKLLGPEGKERELRRHLPLGRLIEPEDVADAIEALGHLAQTTGHLLTVDGGYLCR